MILEPTNWEITLNGSPPNAATRSGTSGTTRTRTRGKRARRTGARRNKVESIQNRIQNLCGTTKLSYNAILEGGSSDQSLLYRTFGGLNNQPSTCKTGTQLLLVAKKDNIVVKVKQDAGVPMKEGASFQLCINVAPQGATCPEVDGL